VAPDARRLPALQPEPADDDASNDGHTLATKGLTHVSTLTAVDAVLALLLIALAWSHLATRARFRRLLRGAGEGNLEQLLVTQQAHLEAMGRELADLKRAHAELTRRVDGCVLRPRILRFNAFQGTGSDLSFALALTDASGSGAVLSSIYGRDECRMYAKPVEKGRSSYTLSDEERQVLGGGAAD
jgi:hypothetical protein